MNRSRIRWCFWAVLVLLAAIQAGCHSHHHGAAVPDVIGMEQAEAKAAIVAAGLVIGSETAQYSDMVPAGHIIGQSPLGGELVPPGTPVHLLISVGFKENYGSPGSVFVIAGAGFDPDAVVWFDGSSAAVYVHDSNTIYGWSLIGNIRNLEFNFSYP